MKIAFIGAGNLAAGLGKFWYLNGHELFVSASGNFEKLKDAAASIAPNVRYGTPSEAAVFADFIVLLLSGSQQVEGQAGSIFMAGDHPEAKQIASNLLLETGSAVVDAGPLTAARFIEATNMLLIHLAYKQGFGSNLAMRLLHGS